MDSTQIADIAEEWAVGPVEATGEVHPGHVWRVELEDGESLILKDIGAGEDVARRFAFELDVLRHLDRAGVGVAVPMSPVSHAGREALVEREGRLYTLSRMLPSESGWDELDRVGLVRLNRRCGAAIARLHAALATYPAEGLEQRTWQTVLPDEWFERSIPAIRQGLSAPQRAPFDALIASVAGELRLAATGLPQQLIHRDCHHGNIVVNGEQVSGFVDCDHLSLGPRVLDLADFLVHAIKGHTDDREAAEEWFRVVPAVLEGYEGEIRLSTRERRAVYAMMLGILLIFAAWFYEVGTPEHAPRELETLEWMVAQRMRIRSVVLP